MYQTLLMITSLILCLLPSKGLLAEKGHPVAVIVEPDGWAVETMNGFRITVYSSENSNLSISELSDPSTTEFQLAHELKFDPQEKNDWHITRKPNALKSVCEPGASSDAGASEDEGAIVVRQQHLNEDKLPATWIKAAGVTVLDLGKNRITEKMDALPCDVIIATRCPNADSKSLQQLSEKMKPQFILIAANNDNVKDSEVTTIGDRNTIAVSHQSKKSDKAKTTWVKISDQPWQMPASGLKELFERKEASCASSRNVFAELSAQQMNFVPSNGSHTPRWNTEHMMGRELLFFSQIYNAVDEAIPVMNLNPKQMPPDYKAAHPDWSGREEALQTLRVEAFTRRFAWLLADMPLDKKARGSRMWTPSRLLKQMERHYKEHTDNVKKKMKLENWPAQ